jgi:hypothetical protein
VLKRVQSPPSEPEPEPEPEPEAAPAMPVPVPRPPSQLPARMPYRVERDGGVDQSKDDLLDVRAAQFNAATRLQARVRGRQARARHRIVTAPLVSLSLEFLRPGPSTTDTPAQPVQLSCPGISASWSGSEGVSAPKCDLVATMPLCADGPLQDAAALRGNVALIERGGSNSFSEKARVAARAGAVAVIFINNQPGTEMVAPMASAREASHPPLAIPAVCIAQKHGKRLRELLHEVDTDAQQSAFHYCGPASKGAGAAVSVRWSVLTFDWAARRIQNSWRRRSASHGAN